MTQKQSNPAACADRARKPDCLAAVTSEITAGPSDNQTIALGDVVACVVADIADRRASYLARRFRIAPNMAATIAPMVFGGEAKR